MPGCTLRYCTNTSKNVSKSRGITFHRFPRPGHGMREKWIKFVQIDRSEETWLPSDYTYICSLHFREEDKYTTKEGRLFLKKSAVPCNDPSSNVDPGTPDAISEPVSDSESIFDSPRRITLKQKLEKANTANKKLSEKMKKIQRQNKYLKKKCESLTSTVTTLRKKLDDKNLGGTAESNLKT